MKKVILSAAVVALGLAAVSCSKSYTCECNTHTSVTSYTNYQNTSPDPSNTSAFTTIKKNETDAATECNAKTTPTTTTSTGTYVSGNYTLTSTYTNCDLQPTLE